MSSLATLYGPNGQKKVVTVGSAEASTYQSNGWTLTAKEAAGKKWATLYSPPTLQKNGELGSNTQVVAIGSKGASQMQGQGWALTSEGPFTPSSPLTVNPQTGLYNNPPPTTSTITTDETTNPTTTTLAPETSIPRPFIDIYNERLPGWQKTNYIQSVKDYGIRNPDTEKALGITDADLAGIDFSQTQWGTAEAGYGSKIALTPQQFADAVGQLDIDKTNAQAGWDNLKKRIGSGELDVNGQEYRDIVSQLTQMTQAVQATKQSLSASGNYFGGAYQKQIGNAQIDPVTGRVISGQVGQALQPYTNNIQDIHSQYGYQRGNAQADYDTAMATYMGNKKTTTEKYGQEQGTGGMNAQGFEYGGGAWNPTTGTYDVAQGGWGMTPQQAQAAGLGFFGTDIYQTLLDKEAERLRLLGLETGAQGNALITQTTGLHNELGY